MRKEGIFIAVVVSAINTCAFCAERMSIRLLDDKIRIGGQFLIREELKSDYYTRDGKQKSDETLSSRLRLSIDVRPKEGLGFFFTIIDTHDWDDPHPYLSPYAYDHPFDIQQAYIYYSPKESFFSFWAGRREVVYLNERLIGTSIGWVNKTITYDGAGFSLKRYNAKLDIFYLNRVIPERLDEESSFNDDWFKKPADLYGFWLTKWGVPIVRNLEFYGLYNDTDNGNDSYTFGFRVYGQRGRFDYDTNISLQFGNWRRKFGAKTVSATRRAQAFYIDLGYRFENPLPFRIAIQYNFASGDKDPRDHKYETFDQLYGCVHGKYGLMDFFRWQNMHDLYTYIDIKSSPCSRFLFGIHSFWLAQPEDAWYNTYNAIQRLDTTGRAHRFVGNEIDILFVISFLKNFKLKLFYGHFFPATYIRDTGKSRDADYTYYELSYEF